MVLPQARGLPCRQRNKLHLGISAETLKVWATEVTGSRVAVPSDSRADAARLGLFEAEMLALAASATTRPWTTARPPRGGHRRPPSAEAKRPDLSAGVREEATLVEVRPRNQQQQLRRAKHPWSSSCWCTLSPHFSWKQA